MTDARARVTSRPSPLLPLSRVSLRPGPLTGRSDRGRARLGGPLTRLLRSRSWTRRMTRPRGVSVRFGGSLAIVLAEQEQEIYGAAGGLGVRPGDIVIDGGAHVGLFTRTALAAGASLVVTFEVTPKSNQALRRNFAKEIADGRVIVMEKGVWREEGSLPLVIVERCSVCNCVSHPWMPATIDVPLTTIDHAVTELKLPRVDYIKLDIENAEANALRGATRVLARYHPRLAVALENSTTRVAYRHEVLGVVQEAFAGCRYACGAVTPRDQRHRILPEILHFYTR